MRTISQKDLKKAAKDGKISREDFKRARVDKITGSPPKKDPITALSDAIKRQQQVHADAIKTVVAAMPKPQSTEALEFQMKRMVKLLEQKNEVSVKMPERNKKWHVKVNRNGKEMIDSLDVEVTG